MPTQTIPTSTPRASMPVVELQRISHNARLSQETPAYTADIWIDGKKAGTTRNDGQGGADHIRPWTLREQLNAIAAKLPPLPPSCAGGEPIAQDAETLLHTLLTDHVERAALVRRMKRKTVFVNDGKIWESPATPEAVISRHPAALVLNALPVDEALRVMRSHASG